MIPIGPASLSQQKFIQGGTLSSNTCKSSTQASRVAS